MISKSTLSFLEQLSKNNEREWFQKHKEEYEKARHDALSFAGEIIKKLAVKDPVIPSDLDPKTCLMRIFRDIRFSKDKTPFKTNFGIAISANGKNFNGPGYYIHLQPERSFIAGGSWYPEGEQLKSIRQELDYNSSDWKEILENKEFKSLFEDLDTEGKLKTAPKGYPADHPLIEYLKLKSFTVSHSVTDDFLTGKDAADKTARVLEKLYPFISFLRAAIS